MSNERPSDNMADAATQAVPTRPPYRWALILALWIPLGLTILLAYSARHSQRSRDVDAQWVAHTIEVKAQLEQLDSLVKDVESSQRGYLLTGNTNFLAPYDNAIQEIPDQSHRLAALIVDNPKQVAAVARMQILMAGKLSLTAESLALARAGNFSDAIQIVKSGKEKQLMDEIALQAGVITAEENELLVGREIVFAAQGKRQNHLMIGLVSADIALIMGATVLILTLRKSRLVAETLAGEANTRTEQALRASELSYRRLFEAAQDGILILDVNTGRINDVNPYLCKLLGFSRAEMIGKTVGELSPFKDIEENRIMLQRLQKEGYVRYEDLPLETRDGRHIAVEFVSNVYEAGDVDVIQCNIRDITEHKAAEALSVRLAAIVESSDDAIIGKDLEGNVTSWNKGAEKIFGYAEPEMLATSIRRIIPANCQDEENRILLKIKDGGSVGQFESQRQTKDGRLIDVSVTVSPVKDVNGKVVGVSKVARDISERKLAEEKIRQLNVDLEQRVIERTAQLNIANEELEAFSYSVSHDLRAPLRHVMGFVELLHKDLAPALSGKNLGYLKTISDSAKRMGNLIDDLLDFSRVGRAEMKMTNINLDEQIRDVLGDFQLETQGRNILWDIHPLPFVRADRALLRLVLVNLISNAVKFTGHCEEAKIEIGCVPGDDGETVIFVRDNGAGFDPLYVNKLFGVFQRLHSTAEFEGTGIGLANIKRIILRHGGRVWAEGAVGGGATFYFSILKQTNGAAHAH